MKTGPALIANIDTCRPAPGGLALWWLGQHSFVLKLGEVVVYVDPFLTPMGRREVPPLLAADQIANASVVCGTHDHADHVDRPAWPAIAAVCPQAQFVVPEALLPALPEELGIPAARFVGLDDGTSAEVAGVRITAVPAAHELVHRDEAGRCLQLGYVIEAGGRAVYHAGDTCLCEGMQQRLRRWEFDAVLLPINGRDPGRLSSGCIGNMTYQEAADLAGALRGPGGDRPVAIPTHWDMFAGNSEDPALFTACVGVKYPDLPVRICPHGERVVLKRASLAGTA